MKKYGYTKKTNLSFNDALIKIESTLKKEGFGVLTKIDMKEKMKEKLSKNIGNYMIFGACNPSLAFEAIAFEQEIGLFLPCNIIIYSKLENVYISTILPTVVMNDFNNDGIKKIADKAEKSLKIAIDNV